MTSDVILEDVGLIVTDLHIEYDLWIGEVDLDTYILIGQEDGGSDLTSHIHAAVSLRTFPACLDGERLSLGYPSLRVLGRDGTHVLHLGGTDLRNGDGCDTEHFADGPDGGIRIGGLHVVPGTPLGHQGLDPVLHQHGQDVVLELILESPSHGRTLEPDLRVSNEQYGHTTKSG